MSAGNIGGTEPETFSKPVRDTFLPVKMTYLPNGFVGKASIWCLVYGKAEVQIPNSVWGFCGGGIVYCPS